MGTAEAPRASLKETARKAPLRRLSEPSGGADETPERALAPAARNDRRSPRQSCRLSAQNDRPAASARISCSSLALFPKRRAYPQWVRNRITFADGETVGVADREVRSTGSPLLLTRKYPDNTQICQPIFSAIAWHWRIPATENSSSEGLKTIGRTGIYGRREKAPFPLNP